ncbi:hypothetical protein BVX99_03310, partial [bacterium F16]
MNISIKDIYKFKKELNRFKNKKVLLWDPAPYPVHVEIAAAIGTALALRGCAVEQILCDGIQIGCVARSINCPQAYQRWSSDCSKCFEGTANASQEFALPTSFIGDILSIDDIQRFRALSQDINLKYIVSFIYKGIPIGLHAQSSFNRYYKGCTEDLDDNILRLYFYSCLAVAESAIRKIDAFKPDVLFLTHAIYNT